MSTSTYQRKTKFMLRLYGLSLEIRNKLNPSIQSINSFIHYLFIRIYVFER